MTPAAAVITSSDLAETVRIHDRVVVMREGRIVGDLNAEDTTVEHLLTLCFGGTPSDAHRGSPGVMRRCPHSPMSIELATTKQR